MRESVTNRNVRNKTLHRLYMDMFFLSGRKQQFLTIKTKFDTRNRRSFFRCQRECCSKEKTLNFYTQKNKGAR